MGNIDQNQQTFKKKGLTETSQSEAGRGNLQVPTAYSYVVVISSQPYQQVKTFLGQPAEQMLGAALESAFLATRLQDFTREELLDMAGYNTRYWACYLLQRTEPNRPGRNVYIGWVPFWLTFQFVMLTVFSLVCCAGHLLVVLSSYLSSSMPACFS